MAVAALALLAPGAAVAQGGTSTSAGDQQYVDPLKTTSTSTPAPTSSPPASSSSSSSSSSNSQATTPSPSTAPPTTTHPAAGSSTLPYTGLNVWTLIGAGAGLLGAGLLLWRLARRAY